MKKSELLKLKEGQYLVTDKICNYTYILTRYEHDTMVCGIKERGSLSFNSVNMHYDLVKDYDDEYDRYIPRKRMDTSINVGGLHVHKNGSGVLYDLHIVGIYNKDSLRKDMINFSLHHKINMSKYDKKTFKRIR